MIVFKSITLKNIFGWRDVKVPLENQGLVAIDGLNGVGKSSVFEALTCALFGSTTLGEETKDLVNDSVLKNLEVTLELDVLDVPHTVITRRKSAKSGPSISILQDGKDITPKESYVKLKKRVPGLLGLDITKNEFLSYVFHPQEFASIFVFGTGRERREFFSSVFGLEIYDVLHDVIVANAETHGTTLAEISDIESEIHHIKSSDIYQLIEGGVPDVDHLMELEKKRDALGEQIDKLDKLKDRILIYHREKDARADLRNQLKDFSNLPDEIDPALISKEILDLREKYRTLDKHLGMWKATQTARQEFKKARKRIRALKFDPKVPLEEIQAQRKQVKDKLKEYKDQRNRLDVLSGKVLCPTCQQDLDMEQTESLIESIRRKVNEAERSFTALTEVHTLCLERDRRQSLAGKVPNDFDKTDAKSEMKSTEEIIDQKEDLLSDISDREAIIKQLEKTTLPKKPKRTRKEVDDRHEKLSDKKDALAETIGSVKEEARRQKRVAKQLKSLEKRLKSLRKEAETLTILEELKAIFNPHKGIKVKHLHAVLQAFEKELPFYANRMFGGSFSFEVDDAKDDAIEILAIRAKKGDNRVKRPLKVLSGGQRGRFAIAAQLSLAKIISKSKQSNIIVFDEPGGGWLDRKGKEAFVELLQDIRTQYSSVFVITHDSYLREACQPDQTWTITQQNDTSKLQIGN